MTSTTRSSALRRRSLVTAVVALAVLLAFEFGVARSKWAYELTPGVFVASVYALEDNVVEGGPVPEVLLFGSSRIQDGVSPRLLEQKLGLDTGQVMNLAFPFGDVVASRILYERNRSRLRQAEVAVIGVEMWDLFGERRLDPTEEFFLPMDQRLEHSGKDRASLLVSAVWKTYAARKMAGYLFGGFLRGGPDYGPLGPDGRLQYFETIPTGPDVIDASEQFDDRFAALERAGALSGNGDRAELQRLIDILREDGLEVVIVHLPLRRDFVTEVEARLPTVVTESQRVLDDLRGPALVAMETTLEAWAVPDNVYRDFGHAAESGIDAVTQYVADLVTELDRRSVS